MKKRFTSRRHRAGRYVSSPDKKNDNRHIIFSVSLHVLLLLGFIFASYIPTTHHSKPQSARKTSRTIHAVAVKQADIDATVNAIKHQRLQKEKAQQKKLKDLALQAKRAKQQRIVEQKRLAALKKAKQKARKALLAAKRQREREQKRAATQKKHERELQRQLAKQLASEQQELDTSRLRHVKTVVVRYTALIQHAIGQYWLVPDNVMNKSCQLLIRLAPDGEVLSVKLIKSSGDAALDNSAQVAVHKASPLPVPGEPDVFNEFRVLRLTVHPERIAG